MSSMIRLLSNLVLWFIWVPFRKVIERLPFGTLAALAYFSGELACLFPTRRRALLREELTSLYGAEMTGRELAQVSRRAFGLFFRRQAENLVFGGLSKETVQRHSYFEGLQNFEQATNRGNGVILLLAHFGSFLFPPLALAYRGFPVIQIVGPPLVENRGRIHRKILEIRKLESGRLPLRFEVAHGYLGSVVRALRENSAVVIAFDGRAGLKWEDAPLLNRVGRFSTGPFKLARQTGATIIPTFSICERDRRHRIVFEPEIPIPPAGDLRTPLLRFAAIFERHLRAYPDHFAMTLVSQRLEAEAGLNQPLFADASPGTTPPETRLPPTKSLPQTLR